MLTADLLHWIDHARTQGLTYDHVTAKLEEAGHPDVKRIMDEYTGLIDRHGRRRDEVNPGDPADPETKLGSP